MHLACICAMDCFALPLTTCSWFPKFMPLKRMFLAWLGGASYSSRQAHILRQVWEARKTTAS